MRISALGLGLAVGLSSWAGARTVADTVAPIQQKTGNDKMMHNEIKRSFHELCLEN